MAERRRVEFGFSLIPSFFSFAYRFYFLPIYYGRHLPKFPNSRASCGHPHTSEKPKSLNDAACDIEPLGLYIAVR
jgi:hypothetical protein